MALAVTHSTVVVTADDGTSEVGTNEWNAAHTLTGEASPAQGGTGVANNAASTLAISGNFATTLTVSGTTGITLPTSGTLATLAGSEELDNKTLDSSVGKGTWTTSGTWTLPAITLGGTVSGGGQQLNNIIIGTTTPLAGTFTALTATAATLTQGTITDPAPNINSTVTWNDAADTFVGWKLNVTITNAGNASSLFELQANSSTLFGVSRFGVQYGVAHQEGTDIAAPNVKLFNGVVNVRGSGLVAFWSGSPAGGEVGTAADTGLSRTAAGVVGIGTGSAGSIVGHLQLATISRTAPVTETGTTHTVAVTTTSLICNQAGTVTVTLPAAASFPGRELYIKTITANTVVSNASNVAPSTSPTAGTAILPATDGAWALLVSDGTNWIIMAANPLV